MRRRRFVITIDGPSGTGKSTAARNLAKRLGYLYLDTGAMYRAVALKAVRRKVRLTDRRSLAQLADRSAITFRLGSGGRAQVLLDGKDVTRAIRSPEISDVASQVATIPGVRRALVRQQRAIGRAGGVVAEGRDTGTVVFPDAPLKFFMSAGLAQRAKRRFEELKASGHRVAFAQVLKEIRERDRRDQQRSISPLRPARGAVRIDNTRLQPDQVLAKLIDYVARGKSCVCID